MFHEQLNWLVFDGKFFMYVGTLSIKCLAVVIL